MIVRSASSSAATRSANAVLPAPGRRDGQEVLRAGGQVAGQRAALPGAQRAAGRRDTGSAGSGTERHGCDGAGTRISRWDGLGAGAGPGRWRAARGAATTRDRAAVQGRVAVRIGPARRGPCRRRGADGGGGPSWARAMTAAARPVRARPRARRRPRRARRALAPRARPHAGQGLGRRHLLALPRRPRSGRRCRCRRCSWACSARWATSAAGSGPATVGIVEGKIVAFARQVFTPEVVDQLIAPTASSILTRGRADVVSVGFLIALWAGSSAIASVVDSITEAHGQNGVRHPVWQRLFSLLIYLFALVVAVFTLPMVALGPDLLPQVLPGGVAPDRGGARRRRSTTRASGCCWCWC